jgi:hypothetical protein
MKSCSRSFTGGYTLEASFGQRAAQRFLPPIIKRNELSAMRSVIWIVVAIVLVGGIVALSRKDTSKPLVHVEKIVPDNALSH